MTENVDVEIPTLPRFFHGVRSNSRFWAPMTEEETKTFLTIQFASESNEELTKPMVPSQLMATMELKYGQIPSQLAIIVGRLQSFSPEMRYRLEVILTLASMTTSPGECIMLAFGIWQETKAKGDALTHFEFVRDCIPFGFPTREAYEDLWDKQKRNPNTVDGLRVSDNWLDDRQVWQ